MTAVQLGAPARGLHPVGEAPRLSAIGAELTRQIEVTDECGDHRWVHIPIERELTVMVDGRVIGRLWTLGSQPEWLVLGYLRNRQLIHYVTEVESITIDWDAGTATVLTRRTYPIDWRVMLANSHDAPRAFAARRRLTRTALQRVLKAMQGADAVHRAAGSVQACALFGAEELWLSVEDVSRRNCFDVIAGWMALHGVAGEDKMLLTTGRLTAEVVIKAAINGIPIVVTLKGVTSACLDLASRLDMTIIGHAGPQHHLCYVGAQYLDAGG